MIFKTALSAVALIPLLFNSALAGDADFTLTNRTGYDIDSVYVVPSKQRDWGIDRLGKSILADGRSRFLAFNKSGNNCIYDLSVGWVGYSEDEDSVWERINLCEIHTITLRYNAKTKVTTMTAE
jgi:hypothetical protein